MQQAENARDGLMQRAPSSSSMRCTASTKATPFPPHVESGLFTFIGATTENPVRGQLALLSRAAGMCCSPVG